VEPNRKLFPDHSPSIIHGTLSFIARQGLLVHYGHLGNPFDFFLNAQQTPDEQLGWVGFDVINK
jgi:hypothetical protein